ncbi:MAG: hypothetical protein Q8R32_00595 [bacterium]|nr:hypothetical protein [bacterium]
MGFKILRRAWKRSPRLAVLLVGSGLILGAVIATPRVTFVDLENGAGRGDTSAVWNETTVGQTIIPRREGLFAIDLVTIPNPPLDQEIELTIRRLRDRADLVVLRGPVEEFLAEDDTIRLSFRPLSGVRDTPLLLTVAAPKTPKDQAVPLRFEVASGIYPDGERLVNGRARPGDLGFTTRAKGGFLESWKHRFLVGRAGQWFAGMLLVLVSGLLLQKARPASAPDRWRWHRSALLLSLALALLATFPVYARLGNWAHDESDWTEVVSYFAATRHALSVGQFPGWSPYICGGSPHFANPQAFFLFFPLFFSLLLGDIVGLKIGFTVVLALGFFGSLLLAKTLKLNGAASLLPGIVFLLSGFATTHLSNGQFLWLTLAWVPWVVMGFLRSFKNPWWSLVAAGFLILTFVEGRLYLVAYGALFLCLLALVHGIQRRSWRPAAILILVGILTILGSSWKLLPALTFLRDAETSLPNTDGIPLAALDETLLRRDVTPNGTDHFGAREIPRHEYAAYVGALPLLLALFSVSRATRRRALPFIVAGFAFLFLATQRADASLLEYVPLVSELRNPGRMISMVVFSLGILSGLGLQGLENFLGRIRAAPSVRRMLPGLLVLVILGNLLAVSWTHLSTLFQFPPAATAFDEPGFFQTKLPEERQVNNGYPAVTAGKGAKDFCPVVLRAYRPVRAVRAREDQGYRGEVYAVGAARLFDVLITPNVVTARVEAESADTVVVNQNFARGWTAEPFRARNEGGLIGVDVPAGSSKLTLRYRTPYLGPGSIISLATALALGALWTRSRSRRRHGTAERPRSSVSGSSHGCPS